MVPLFEIYLFMRFFKKWFALLMQYKGQLTDVNFVRLLESFLESAPQVVLQIYIMIKTVDVVPITGAEVRT